MLGRYPNDTTKKRIARATRRRDRYIKTAAWAHKMATRYQKAINGLKKLEDK